MKCTIIFGSPRKNGNTYSLLRPFMDELQRLGMAIDFYDVYDMNIKGCQVCLKCQENKTAAACAVEDDMTPLLNSMAAADLIVYAAPVYIWAAPAPVKAVIDRSVYASCKYYGDDPFGPALFGGKYLALVTSCGYPIEKGADLYEEMMKRYGKHCKMIWSGMLAERQRNLKEVFMTPEKERHARIFAEEIVQKIRMATVQAENQSTD